VIEPPRLADIVAALGGELLGDPELPVERIGPVETATSSTISFISHPRYRAQLATTNAGVVIVDEELRDDAARRGATIVTADPYLYFARLTQWWAARARAPLPSGVHSSAAVDASARLGAGVHVGPFALVEAEVEIGDGALIGPYCHLGVGARVGAFTRLVSRVSLGERCGIGARGIVHPGVVIGADGFGFAPDRSDGHWEKIEQLGAVRIGDDVEIGANSCIDRGALEDTVVGNGVKLDNLVQVGHNVKIGDHCAMAGCVGIAGSATIGRHCQVGGGAIILGHLTLADHVHVSAATVIMRSIAKPGLYSGVFPFDENAAWEKNAATLRQLYALRERLRLLEAKR
jgi:UDP-3-O-[3-hydroxymyristoyl] glucosamine N-acyltransferase